MARLKPRPTETHNPQAATNNPHSACRAEALSHVTDGAAEAAPYESPQSASRNQQPATRNHQPVFRIPAATPLTVARNAFLSRSSPAD
jgi:hypothetical protein